MKPGLFISFEGIEGAGKSTHARMLAEHLGKRGVPCVLTAEPGGTPLGTRIRELLLSVEFKGMDAVTELLLYSAARRQHLEELILPALEEGKVVITDRFSDSTRAYQGAARGIGEGVVRELDRIVTGGIKPDLTLLLDVEVRAGLARNREAGKTDRLEQEEAAFHERVREGFLEILRSEPERVKLIDASKGLAEVHEAVVRLAEELLSRAGLAPKS